jgi:hypothetical protein
VSSVGSSSEVNLPVTISNQPAESEGDFANSLNEISYDLKIEGAPDLPLQDGGYADTIDFNLSNNCM